MFGSSQRRIAIAIGLAVVGAALFFGVRHWRERAARQRIVERVLAYGRALTRFEACVTRGVPGELGTAVVFAHAGGDPDYHARCKEPFDAALASFGATTRALGLLAPPHVASLDTIPRDEVTAPVLGAPLTLEHREHLCEWIRDAHRDLEVMFDAIGRAPPEEVGCGSTGSEPIRPKMLPTLGEYVSASEVYPLQIVLRDATGAPSLRDIVAFVPSRDRERSEGAIARSLDGQDWSGIEVPRDVVIAAPAPHGFVALARGPTPRAPWDVRTNDGQDDRWKLAGKLPARDEVMLLHVDATRITVVGTRPGASDLIEVASSTDGGKSFASPHALVDRRAVAAVDVRALADGAVVALSLPRSTPDEVAVARLAPGAARLEASTVTLTAPIAAPTLTGCHGRTGYYAIIGDRFLVGSGDSGATWKQLADLAPAAGPFGLYCTADRVIVTRAHADGLDLTACTAAGCDPPASAPGDDRVLFARARPDHLEVWLENETMIRREDYRGYIVRVYTLADGVLTPARFHVMPKREYDDVAARFVDLGDAIGWLDPRSGAGAAPWLSVPPPPRR